VNGPNLWSKHYRNVWIERSVDPRLPAWLRCAALAYGLHAANGHAPLAPGELAVILGKPGATMHKSNVARTIREAKDLGFIAPASYAGCLVVPQHAIGGPVGNPHAPCKQRHPRLSLSDNRGSQILTTDNALTCDNARVLLESLNSTPEQP